MRNKRVLDQSFDSCEAEAKAKASTTTVLSLGLGLSLRLPAKREGGHINGSSPLGRVQPAIASAPGKLILMGEHAVVHGEPAIAVAVGLRTRVSVAAAPEGRGHLVNGRPMNPHHHAFLIEAIERYAPAEAALSFDTVSRVPSAAGLGSSAALTTATVAALLASQGDLKDEESLARAAYDVEWRAQGGRGSPTDTSTVTHGRGVLVDRDAHANLLWSIERGERRWHLHHLDLPPLHLVVGNTGERGKTADQVAKVARFVRRTGFALEIVRDIGVATRAALAAVEARDTVALGRAMDRAHNSLTILGVSTPTLDRYCVAARRAGALGAKLTGSGGGGSMIALVGEDAAPVVAALRKAGCREPLVVALNEPGARIEEAEEE